MQRTSPAPSLQCCCITGEPPPWPATTWLRCSTGGRRRGLHCSTGGRRRGLHCSTGGRRRGLRCSTGGRRQGLHCSTWWPRRVLSSQHRWPASAPMQHREEAPANAHCSSAAPRLAAPAAPDEVALQHGGRGRVATLQHQRPSRRAVRGELVLLLRNTAAVRGKLASTT